MRSETTLGCVAADRAAVESPAQSWSDGMPCPQAAIPGMDCSNALAGPTEIGHVTERHIAKPSARRTGEVQCLGEMPLEAGRLPFEPDGVASVPRLTEQAIAHRRQMLEYLASTARRRA